MDNNILAIETLGVFEQKIGKIKQNNDELGLNYGGSVEWIITFKVT